MLATIPARDARGQVQMMNEYLEKRFGCRPKGFWLTERIWDPGLPLVLAGSGLQYTIVDDTHFYYAGLKPPFLLRRAQAGPYLRALCNGKRGQDAFPSGNADDYALPDSF
ncbi:MAG: hypothetical protein B1H13_06175 [Desulfobacteraceae bacterium 4484_190.3]|nr:MAG: hypothetical protein B1H13_06175 [Desulfobacteraceae bacterium 4484_190.3]